MPLPIAIAALLFVLYVASSFGARIPAGRSPLWWLFLGFIMIAAWVPLWLRPIANWFGVELISNLVLAFCVLFLVFQLFAEIAAGASTYRALRQTVAGFAARDAKIQLSHDQLTREKPKVLIVIPCHNEEEAAPLVAAEMRLLSETHGYDFIFVDDASTDRTYTILDKHVPGHVAHHVSNIGVSGVLLTGFLVARTHDFAYVVQCDGDGQHPVSEIPRLVEETIRHNSDLTIGSRFVASQSLESTTGLRRLGSLVLVAALRTLFPSLRVSDPTSGFRIYSARAYRSFLQMMPERYPEPESLALAAAAELSVREIAVTMKPRTTGQSSLVGLATVAYMIRVLSALFGLRLRTWFRGMLG